MIVTFDEKNVKTTDNTIPRHVAFIMDGSGRWSKARDLPAIAGHRVGAKVFHQIIKKAVAIGIEYLTFFAFSSENWHRPKHWIDALTEVFRYYLENEIKELDENNVKIQIIGNRSCLDNKLIQIIDYAENLTKNNNRLHVFLAISYGGRDEILKATKSISHKVLNKEITVEDITTDLIGEYLYTKGAPDPDLLIRTSGEQRISNFLLWQLAYTEFIFVDCLWPDFTTDIFERCVKDYAKRERRFGTSSFE